VSEFEVVPVSCVETDAWDTLADCDVDFVGSADGDHLVAVDDVVMENETESETVEVPDKVGMSESEKDRESTSDGDIETVLLCVGGGVGVGGGLLVSVRESLDVCVGLCDIECVDERE
jgi:hypothetical protein